MKMPEKHDLLWRNFSRQRNEHQAKSCVCKLAYLRGRYNGGAFTKAVIDATMCAIIADSFVTFKLRRTLSSNLAYITSVFIGYIGTDSIGSLIKRFAAKKAGVEDGRNQ